MNSVEIAANYLIEELKVRGYTIQRYDSITTNSVYVKLDYGVCNSIRIGDHKGKKKYQFLFNVNTARTAPWEHVVTDYTRYYYNGTEDQLNTLLAHVDRHRMKKLEVLGYRGYLDEMANNKYKHKNAEGFWSQAKVIHTGTVPHITNELIEDLNQNVIQW